MKHIVKRKGHTEIFDARKVYASVYAACLAVNTEGSAAELLAEKVTENVKEWLIDKKEVTADDIHRAVTKHLKVYNPDAAYLHETHHIID